jgi:hypothetical protein
MQNKPNFRNKEMIATSVISTTKDKILMTIYYLKQTQNKPKTNPISKAPAALERE